MRGLEAAEGETSFAEQACQNSVGKRKTKTQSVILFGIAFLIILREDGRVLVSCSSGETLPGSAWHESD